MRLVHNDTEETLVEVIDDTVFFHDPLLQRILEEEGIKVPLALQGQFQGKDCIHVSDADFFRAFKEIYVPFSLNACSWK